MVELRDVIASDVSQGSVFVRFFSWLASLSNLSNLLLFVLCRTFFDNSFICWPAAVRVWHKSAKCPVILLFFGPVNFVTNFKLHNTAYLLHKFCLLKRVILSHGWEPFSG